MTTITAPDPDGMTTTDSRANARPMVDFVVIGAMRAGTTTLHNTLSRHPQISMSRDKETDFFIAEKNLSRGADWYRGQFDPQRPLWGEASPNYTKARDFAGVPERVAQRAPDARLIYVVRDPVARAASQFEHSWTMGLLRTLPEDLIGSHEYHSLIDISSYAKQLDLWHAHFPNDQILVVDFDALLAEPDVQVNRILAHVGAESMQLDKLASQNSGRQLSKVPLPLLRLAQGPMRPLLTTVLGPRMRDRLRRLAAIGPRRVTPSLPEPVLQHMRDDLAQDTARFREMTGLELAHWSV
ncbi:sulfotransferase family protein [Paracoccus tegillarcae]|uniref:Sulfotransferase n=1 Tax=Paracoccus tegillarcae TaxID=1529068 RepID=A0A2K9EYJ7_9RHOB|nr:sulfotransferase [Paracoccus tegillarcae]AUH33182.1 sulfotransferase [Paracoccus tegillarcae]